MRIAAICFEKSEVSGLAVNEAIENYDKEFVMVGFACGIYFDRSTVGIYT
jgi:hypothetical protein